MKSILTAMLSILVFSSFSFAGDGWRLVWSDEFNTTNLDPATWGFDLGRGPNNDGYGSWSYEYFTDSPENAFLTNGCLAIRVKNEAIEGQFLSSAQVTTKGKRSFLYGRIEARMKLPRGYGMWPGFCMFGTNQDIVSWPECGEIDVMEMRGGDAGDSNRTILGTLHYRNGSKLDTFPEKWSYESSTYRLKGKDDFSGDFHVFGIIWESNRIIFTADSVPYATNWTRVFYKSAFRLPFYVYFNVKIGGEFYNHAIRSVRDVTAPLPQTMLVDWIRYSIRE